MRLPVCILLLFAVVATLRLPAEAVPLPLDDTWVVLDQDMSTNDFFTGTWTWSSTQVVRFSITDLFVISDQFKVYDFGTLVATTPFEFPWYLLLGVTDPFESPPFTDDPDEAYASGFYSAAELFFPAGAHSITIQDILIPLDSPDGVPFPDGTVAFKAAAIPEPSTFVLSLTGLVAIVMGRMRLRRGASRGQSVTPRRRIRGYGK